MGACVGKPVASRRRGTPVQSTGKTAVDQEGVDEVDNPSVVGLGAVTSPLSASEHGGTRRALVPAHYVPADEWGTCAYCDNPTGDRYDYFYSPQMSPELLEELAEHGWWRTGQVIFKPRMSEVCCPSYAIRVPVADFIPSKSHRRIVRRWKRFLSQGHPRWEGRARAVPRSLQFNRLQRGGEDEVDFAVVGNVESARLHRVAVAGAVERVGPPVEEGMLAGAMAKGSLPSVHGRLPVEEEPTRRRARKPVTQGRGADPNKPLCRKAKAVRVERRQHKLAALGDHSCPTGANTTSQHPLTLQELLRDEGMSGAKHRLQVKLLPCNPRDPQLQATLHRAYEIYNKFQALVHPGKVRFESLSEFKWGFFNTPLRNPTNRLLGTYHMHYYLDGELIMISILDILPQYLVSIYFIYDPDIRFMTPGIYTCLREMALVLTLQRERPELQYYALGYYNRLSPKVSYKRQFGPQEILCNETDTFVPLVPSLTLLPYSRLAQDSPEKQGRSASIDDVVIRTNEGDTVFKHLTPLQKALVRPAVSKLMAEAGPSAVHQLAVTVAETVQT